MSWIIDNSYTWFQKFCINVVKSGKVPKHVAFIMDGNRRFAKKNHVQKREGHVKGFDKLAETLQWCLDLGIPEVTVYAFSIENFKRSPEEVETLMKLAKEKFAHLLEKEMDRVMADGVCIRIIGNLSLLDDELRSLIAKLMLKTKDNKTAFLNIAFAYTSRDEITTAIKDIMKGVEEEIINENDIDERLISSCLYTNKSPNPDLLVRTSGEVRFSDFLLWQISSTQVYFADVLWPEFTLWHLLAAVFNYQRNYISVCNIKNAQQILENKYSQNRNNKRINTFLNNLDKKRTQMLEAYAQA